MTDWQNRCLFPWIYAEIAASGNVTVCHTFYDLVVGNVNKESLLDIWKSDTLKKIRSHVRKELFPVCTACSRFYADPDKR